MNEELAQSEVNACMIAAAQKQGAWHPTMFSHWPQGFGFPARVFLEHCANLWQVLSHACCNWRRLPPFQVGNFSCTVPVSQCWLYVACTLRHRGLISNVLSGNPAYPLICHMGHMQELPWLQQHNFWIIYITAYNKLTIWASFTYQLHDQSSYIKATFITSHQDDTVKVCIGFFFSFPPPQRMCASVAFNFYSYLDSCFYFFRIFLSRT